MSLRLYPSVTCEAQCFKHVKIVTVPNQSMTLKDIIKRFIRKESLPIEHQGVYAEGLGDVEKMAREDITERHERAARLKRKLQKVVQDQKEKEGKVESPSVPATPPPSMPAPPAAPVNTPPPAPAQPGEGT